MICIQPVVIWKSERHLRVLPSQLIFEWAKLTIPVECYSNLSLVFALLGLKVYFQDEIYD